MPKVIKSININNSFKSRLDDLNKDYFKYIKSTVNKEKIKAHELFFTKFTESKKYADIFLRHAININTTYSKNVKDFYLASRVYKNLLYKEKNLFSHPAIGRKLYETETEIALSLTFMTTDLYNTFYDKLTNKPVTVLKLNDYQGIVKASTIIYIDKKYVYN